MSDRAEEQEHAVIVYFDYTKSDMEPLHKLAEQLTQIIDDNQVGEYDGHNIAVNYSTEYSICMDPTLKNYSK